MKPQIMTRLQQDTRKQHDQTEQNRLLSQLMRDDVTHDHYRTVLHKFYGFLNPVEHKISTSKSAAHIELDLSHRQRAGLIVRDLKALGASETDIDALPLCDNLPEFETVPELLGWLYVLEGSTLGGQIISRHLQKTLHVTPETGGAFFYSHGAEVGKMWKEFMTMMDRYTARNGHADRIVDAAQQAFRRFDEWLS